MVVGRPLSMLLLHENATVTICHSRTASLPEVCREADILTACVGKAAMINHTYVKKDAVVIDVGINVDENGKLCGDVDFADLEGTASAATPVPGGVGGVTTAVTGPGSANVLGGMFVAMKLYGDCVDDMILKYPAAMKIAFGENPKGVYGQNGHKMPVTRMAVAATLRETLFKAQRYAKEIEEAEKDAAKTRPFDMKLEALLPVLRKEIPLKAHAHRADDILTAIRIAKEFDVDITLDHVTEGHLIVRHLVKAGKPVLVGPSFGSKSKQELREKSFATAGILDDAGLEVCIITDAPVIPLYYLPLCAGLAVKAGMKEESAWRAITINPAHVVGIDGRVGSIEAGKDADIAIFEGNPLRDIQCRTKAVFVNGEEVLSQVQMRV